MTHLRFVSLGLGLVLGTSVLMGCGQRETLVEPSTPDPEADTNAANPTDTPTQDSSEPTAIAPEKPTAGAATAINPPKSATLKAQQADAQINLRARPTTDATAQGYGLVGDPVQLLQAAEGSDGLTWYYVKFNESGAEGWIRGDFVNTAGTSVSASFIDEENEVDIDSFTTDEIFAVGSGGCGMTLWPVDTREFIFFNGMEGTGMWMKLDGEMTEFRRTAASGPEFYGQSGSQRFVSLDGTTEVSVTANVGSEKGYEAVNIEQGTLRLEAPAGVTEIAVAGDAGC